VCGDSRIVLRGVPDNSVRLIVTSPPYWDLVDYGVPNQIGQTGYEEYIADLLAVWEECERVLCPNGKLCINTPIVPVPKSRTPKNHTRELKNLNNDIEVSVLQGTDLRRFSLYIWQKQTTEKMFGSYPYPPNIYENNTIEFINVFVKPGAPEKPLAGTKEPNKITQEEWLDLTRQIWWIYPENVARNGIHLAPFPELLPARFIRMYTFGAVEECGFEGDIVLDPFGGIGTTAVAAKTLGRQYISIDISQEFTLLARERVFHREKNPTYDIKLRRLADADRNLIQQRELIDYPVREG
jgi:DNA modification methylase